MSTFKRYLTELSMKREATLDVDTNSENQYKIKIKLEDGEIFWFICNREGKKKGFETWEIVFLDKNNNAKMAPKSKGTALQLFAALPKVVEMFIKAKQPTTFYFTADPFETSRVKLYTRLAKRIAKHGYSLSRPTLNGVKVFLFDKS